MGMIKKYMKRALGKACSSIDVTVIVNSYGRSGSTMLMESVLDAAVGRRTAFMRHVCRRSILDTAWDLNAMRIERGLIFKTHDYPPQNSLGAHARVVYIFSDPVDVVLSLLRLHDELGEEWMQMHYEHLRAQYGEFGKIIDEDQLGLERHLDSWLNEKRFPVAFVRYNDLWQRQNELSDFLGVAIQLPPYKERKAKKQNDPGIIKRLEATYASLRKKVGQLDDFFINSTGGL